MNTAELLADACSDQCDGFELWDKTRQLCDRRMLPQSSHATVAEPRRARQLVTADLVYT